MLSDIERFRGRRRKKLIEAAEWLIEYGPICGNCQKQYNKRKPPEQPPCSTCYIGPLPENKDALKIWEIVKDQYIMGPNGPISLNQNAIHNAMNLYNVRNKKKCFEKVRILGHWWVNRKK